MRWMPPKPEFDLMFEYSAMGKLATQTCYEPLGEQVKVNVLSEKKFNDWYDREIKPLFEDAETVYPLYQNQWTTIRETLHTQKALLIKIEPIKEETAEDILRDLIEQIGQAGIVEYKGLHPPAFTQPNALKKAKAFLEKK